MNYIATIQTIISAVRAIEALMPTSTGKEKFDAVIATIEGIFGGVQSILPQITPVINLVVSAFNAVGIFKKAVPAA